MAAWTLRTVAEVLYSARALCNDTDPTCFATQPDTAMVLLRQSYDELVEKLGWSGDAQTSFTFSAGGYSQGLTSNYYWLGAMHGSWNGEPIGYVEPSEIRNLVTKNGGTPEPGTPSMWSVERTNSPSSTLLVYPSPMITGDFAFTGIVTDSRIFQPGSQLPLDRAQTQCLELMLAKKFVARMTPEDMARLKLGPAAAQSIYEDAKARLDEATWRTGEGSKQYRVKVYRRGENVR